MHDQPSLIPRPGATSSAALEPQSDTATPSPRLFFETASAHERTEVLRGAVKLDLFTQIQRCGGGVEELAQACAATPRAIRILCDYLTVQGFLTKSSAGYALTPDSAFFLSRDAPHYIGGALDYVTSPAIRKSFAELSKTAQVGGTHDPACDMTSSNNPIWVTYAKSIKPLMRLPAQLLARQIRRDRSSALRVLDVAAGHGMFGIAIAQRFPKARCMALDWAPVLEVALENAKEAGVADQVVCLPGNALEIDWNPPHDLILMVNFMHHFDVPTCKAILSKAFDALSEGGQVLILDYMLDPTEAAPAEAVSFALAMLATTPGGDAHSAQIYRDLCIDIGFRNVSDAPFPAAREHIVFAEKGS